MISKNREYYIYLTNTWRRDSNGPVIDELIYNWLATLSKLHNFFHNSAQLYWRNGKVQHQNVWMLKHIMWLQEIFRIPISISSSGWTKKYKKNLTNLNYQLLVGRSGEVVWRWVSNPRRGWGVSNSTGNLSKQSKETQPTQWTYLTTPQKTSPPPNGSSGGPCCQHIRKSS